MKNNISLTRIIILMIILGATAFGVYMFTPPPVPPPVPDHDVVPASEIIKAEKEIEDDTVPPPICEERKQTENDADGVITRLDYCVTGMERTDSRIAAEIASIDEQYRLDFTELGSPETADRFMLDIKSEEFTFDRYPHVQSVFLTAYVNTGGAHPGMMYRTFTFDRSTDRMIGFRDLFQPEHNPLWTLYPLVKSQLMEYEYADEMQIDAATGEENFDNYSNFVIDGDELVIMFEPGTVAAYAAGPQEARVSLDDIQAILKPPFLNLEEIYGEDIPEGAEVMTYEEVVAACEEEGGTWLEEHDECEYAGVDWCADMGAIFSECESACRHDAEAEICTLQCVPVCKF